MTKALPLILLPGLNGDGRVLAPQRAAFPTLIVPQWIAPCMAETLSSYAGRLAAKVDPQGPCVVGGVSFGGIVALELARHLEARHCLLIASARSPSDLPTLIRVLGPLARITPPVAFARTARAMTSPALAMPRLRRYARRLSAEQIAFRRWAIQSLLRWVPPPSTVCPIFQIHGDRDTDFPRGPRNADCVIQGAGHLLTLTHAAQVNTAIASALTRASAL